MAPRMYIFPPSTTVTFPEITPQRSTPSEMTWLPLSVPRSSRMAMLYGTTAKTANLQSPANPAEQTGADRFDFLTKRIRDAMEDSRNSCAQRGVEEGDGRSAHAT